MEGHAANILFRQSWNNLVDLPGLLASLLYNANVSPQDVIVELVLQLQHRSYAGWSGMTASGARGVGVDPIFAHSLTLADSQRVTVNVKIRNFRATSVFLEPENVADWELVELHAAYIENRLIEQSRCVAVGQVLVVYPTKTSLVRLLVKDIGLPAHTYGLIDPFAEISIAPKLREKKKDTARSAKLGRSTRSVLDDAAHGPSVLKRGISLPTEVFAHPELTGYEVYVNLDEVVHVFLRCEYVAVSVIAGPNAKLNLLDTDTEVKDRPAALAECKHVVARVVNVRTPPNTVGLSEKLAVALNVENRVGYKVILEQAPRSASKRPSTFVIHPYITQTKKVDLLNLKSLAKQQTAALAQKLSAALFKDGSMLASPLTNYLKIPILPGMLPNGGLLVFKRNSEYRAWVKPYVTTESKNPPKIEIGDDVLRAASFIQDKTGPAPLEPIYGLQTMLDSIVDDIVTFKGTGCMLYGPSGSGKTLTLKWVARHLQDNHGIFTKLVSCETIMNENLDQLCAHFSKWVNEAVWNSPSILILDNLDKVLLAETEQGDSSLSNQVTEVFISLLQKVSTQKNTNLSLLVSGTSKEAFNKLLAQSHLIDHYYHLSAPDKATRLLILEEYLVNKLGCSVQFDLMDIVLETEGYLPNDMRVLCDRIYYESLHQNSSLGVDASEKCEVQKAYFEKALAGYSPSNLRGVKLEKSSTKWADVGGLTEAKRVLLETLEWPTKYAPIFANCPLRLRSGILLYGYPGCGKTLLASVIAGQCGLNFISIKGPEILNKYIGASEQSVRELFDRAQSAKPCILFFDEFDSIAPKRGHDSTGVTDRVVNQMLTQMDGAEGLDGVYVLAATSRPDLIDSALLRPGRLDKSIICDMPSYEDRLDILKCICAKMDLRDDVELTEVARRTEGFSGADMQGLGYNAYLKAVHEKLAEQEGLLPTTSSKKAHEFFQVSAEKLEGNKLRPAEKVALLQQIEKLFDSQGSGESSEKPGTDKEALKVYVSNRHLLESLAETKPSISASERAKLDKIYAEFVTGRDGNMPDGTASNDVGGRTTLM